MEDGKGRVIIGKFVWQFVDGNVAGQLFVSLIVGNDKRMRTVTSVSGQIVAVVLQYT